MYKIKISLSFEIIFFKSHFFRKNRLFNGIGIYSKIIKLSSLILELVNRFIYIFYFYLTKNFKIETAKMKKTLKHELTNPIK